MHSELSARDDDDRVGDVCQVRGAAHVAADDQGLVDVLEGKSCEGLAEGSRRRHVYHAAVKVGEGAGTGGVGGRGWEDDVLVRVVVDADGSALRKRHSDAGSL